MKPLDRRRKEENSILLCCQKHLDIRFEHG